jgi:hypothetical protein
MERDSRETKSLKGIIILLTIILIASIGINFMLLSMKNKVETIVQHTTDTLIVNRNSLADEVKLKIAALETYKGKNAALDKVIREAVTKVEKMEAEIDLLNRSSRSEEEKNAALGKKTAELNKISEDYLKRIDLLVAHNHILKKKNDSLSTNLKEVNDDKAHLANKINIASTLKIEYLTVTPLKKRFLSKKLESTESAWLVSAFKTCFSIMDNSLAAPGKKAIHIRILTPENQVMGNTVSTAGTFKNAEGELLQYTESKTIDYTGTKSDQCMEYTTSGSTAFPTGTYRVEVYLDGVLSSNLSIVLK